ncbi:adenosine receptor A1-like [Amblyraja radiata]|uniref:adenosine receptor A1-like n=1 Tax=Amblyraja radiata TaxID=386614 RepID=UPI0014040F02|nr:adenosine receptor A1-like [Amblyraja radiata]
MEMVYIAMEVLIAVTSVLGNVLVCWAVTINRALRETTFCFIVSLALADIAVGILAIPLAITISIGLHTNFYSCLLMSCVLIVLTQNSILSLLAIAVDRYLRVKIPTRYRNIVTKKRAWITVGICWLASVLNGMTPLFGWNRSSESGWNFTNEYKKCGFQEVIRMDYLVYFNFFGWLLLPLVITFSLYAELFWIIRKQGKMMVPNATDSTRYLGKEYKLAVSLALVLCLFAACWLPLNLMNTISYFCPQYSNLGIPLSVGILLSHANSAVNPVIYAWRIKKFRVSFLQIWNQYFQCKNNINYTNNYGGQIGKETMISCSV